MPPWTILKRLLSLLLTLQEFFTPNPLPLFVTDTHHPWVKQNPLSSLSKKDAISALCNSTSPLRNQLSIPPDLFHRLEIDNNRVSAGSRLGWRNADARAREILACPLAMASCEEFNLRVYVHHSVYDELYEPFEPPEELPLLFKDLLGGMPRLKKLQWEISQKKASYGKFNDLFASSGMRLEQLEELKIEAHMDGLLLAAPNLKSLEIIGWHKPWPALRKDPWLEMIKVAGTSGNLTDFRMGAEWTAELVESILEAMPQLETLRLDGSMGFPWGDEETDIFENVLSVVKRFPKLSHLALPSAHELGLGFDGGPGCGNAYFNLDGTKYGRQVTLQDMAATEHAGAMVVEMKPPRLESFAIGREVVKIERGGDNQDAGMAALKWPWTGRKREYLLQEWPRYEDVGEFGYEVEDRDGPVLRSWKEDEEAFAGDKDKIVHSEL